MTPMIVEHPLLQHKLSILRNKQTGTKEFRDLVGEIATLLCYEATRDLPLEEVEIETPITMAKTKVLAGRKLALVPILRAGMGMLDGMLRYINKVMLIKITKGRRIRIIVEIAGYDNPCTIIERMYFYKKQVFLSRPASTKPKRAAEPYVRQPPLATENSVYVRRTGIT